jgi:iron complex transport system substrate-binding protein
VQRIASNSMPRTPGIILACVLLFASQVYAQNATPETPLPTSTREVADEVGRTVRIPASITRIVSLAPSLTETVYALGLQDKLVGDTDYCDYPPDAQKKPKVGGAINPNLEEIAALHPDLVLVTKSINRLDTVRALDTLGIPSYAAADPHSVEEIIASTEKLADVLGAQEAGKNLGEDMAHQLADIQERIKSVPPRRVLFIVWTEPLISVGKDTFIADALHRAGAVSIVDSTQSWPQMNLEEVVRLQPEYLVFANSHSEAAARDFDALANLPGWRILDAVRNRRFAVISDAVNRPAPRIVSAIAELARQLHPEAFVESPEGGKESAPKPNQAPPAQKRILGIQFEKPNSQELESTCAL